MAKGKIKKKMQKRFSGRLMLSQKVTKRPGWNHEIAIGWRSKKRVFRDVMTHLR